MKGITIIKLKSGYASFEHDIKDTPPLDQISFSSKLGMTGYEGDGSVAGRLREWENDTFLDDEPASAELKTAYIGSPKIEKRIAGAIVKDASGKVF